MSFAIKNILLPSEYKYRIRCHVSDTSILFEISGILDVSSITEQGIALPLTGDYVFNDFNFFVHNQEQQGYINLYFESKKRWLDFKEYLQECKNKKMKLIKNKVYRYSGGGWQYYESFINGNIEVFGYDDYINKVFLDVDNHLNYNKFLKDIGEMRSINYLLYGPPGVGKTSFIKSIAVKKNLPIFIVNPNSFNVRDINFVFSPKISGQPISGMKILLFEDFDRFLEKAEVSMIISQILNAMDGFEDNGDTIRFFTANNKETILKIDALQNRLSHSFEFHEPNLQMYRDKLMRFLSFYEQNDSAKIELFLEKVNKLSEKITLRPFSNYVIRYLFTENYLDNMILNIEELKV